MSEPLHEDATIDAQAREYEQAQPLYGDLVERVQEILRGRLTHSDIKVASICARVKTTQSFRNKIQRKSYEQPLEQITDLAGVRVVCYYETDLQAIKEISRSVFCVHEEVDKTGELGVDKMGYQGGHIIISLGHRYSGEHYDGINDLRCEVQVRTVLQDAWALISHHLIYKNEASVPDRIKRDINNVASLLEIAQGVFDSVRDKRSTYLAEIETKREAVPEFLSQPIDHDTLAAYTQWKFPDMPISEHWHARLLADLDRGKFRTLYDLDQAVEQAHEAVQAYREENPDWFKYGTDFLTKSLGFVDSEFRQKHPWGDKTREGFRRLEHLVKGK
jgi:putative GTP pyrophosphokinase